MHHDTDLDGTTAKVYLCMVKMRQPAGPREVMRGANLSSPSVAHRHLQKLVDWGLVQRDQYGMYKVVEKVGFKGYFWFGKTLVPRLILYSLFFIGLLIVEILVIAVHMSVGEPLAWSFNLLALVTTASAALFLTEGMRLRSETRKLRND